MTEELSKKFEKWISQHSASVKSLKALGATNDPSQENTPMEIGESIQKPPSGDTVTPNGRAS